jgi:hypothetical protein
MQTFFAGCAEVMATSSFLPLQAGFDVEKSSVVGHSIGTFKTDIWLIEVAFPVEDILDERLWVVGNFLFGVRGSKTAWRT